MLQNPCQTAILSWYNWDKYIKITDSICEMCIIFFLSPLYKTLNSTRSNSYKFNILSSITYSLHWLFDWPLKKVLQPGNESTNPCCHPLEHLQHSSTAHMPRLQHFQPYITKPTLHPVVLHQQIPFHPPSCTLQEEIVFGYQLYTIPNDRPLWLRWRKGEVTCASVYMGLHEQKKKRLQSWWQYVLSLFEPTPCQTLSLSPSFTSRSNKTSLRKSTQNPSQQKCPPTCDGVPFRKRMLTRHCC
jgi:hypothetical protein